MCVCVRDPQQNNIYTHMYPYSVHMPECEHHFVYDTCVTLCLLFDHEKEEHVRLFTRPLPRISAVFSCGSQRLRGCAPCPTHAGAFKLV